MHRKHEWKVVFISLLSSRNCSVFPSKLPLVWHLWQQKINIAVGRRARTRVRETEERNKTAFCHLHYTKQEHRKIFCRFFLDFSLFEDISPHIQIGTETNRKEQRGKQTTTIERQKRATPPYSQNPYWTRGQRCWGWARIRVWQQKLDNSVAERTRCRNENQSWGEWFHENLDISTERIKPPHFLRAETRE